METIVYSDNSTVTGDGSKVHPLAASGGGGTPGGENTDVQFNNSGAFGGDAGLTYDPTTGDFGWTPLIQPATAQFFTAGTGATIFFVSGDTGQIDVAFSDSPGPAGCNITFQNLENNDGGGGITFLTGNGSVSGGAGISINCLDTAGEGVFIGAQNTAVQLIAFSAGNPLGIDMGFTTPGAIGISALGVGQGIFLASGTNGFVGFDMCESVADGVVLLAGETPSGGILIQNAPSSGTSGNVTIGSGPSVGTPAESIVIDSTGVNISPAPTQKVGFYGAAPVVQAAHPTLLSDVITILTNLGLCHA